MDSLKMIVEIASSGTIPFITVVLFILATVSVAYLIYRSLRDFEVYLLERKRLDDEILMKEEETE